MLGKLMKYEFKSTARILIPLYITLLVFALISKIFIETRVTDKLHDFGAIPFFLSVFAYGCTMAAVFIVTFFVIIQRFYKNLLGDEGYLMNTLPVTTEINLTSKISIATLWNIVSGFVAILSIIIMAFKPDAFSNFFHNLFRALSDGYSEFGVHIYIVIIEVIIAVLVYLIKYVTMIYASISIGHLFSKHRILSSFGAFIVLNLITTAISSTIGVAFSYSNISSMFDNINSPLPIHLFFVFINLFNLLFFIAYFIITNYILKNKLNLE